MPLTDTEIHTIEAAVTTPAQRLIVALVVVHAARAATIRQLTLDDLDLPNYRITLAGHTHRLRELTRHALQTWLEHGKTAWPHSPNRHVLISAITAIATPGQQRLPPKPDPQARRHHRPPPARPHPARSPHRRRRPLHLSLVFNLSLTTASRYADIAQQLLADQPAQRPRSLMVDA